MKQCASLVFLLLCTGFGLSQEKAKGPVIQGFGAVWDIPNPTYKTDPSAVFRAWVAITSQASS